LQSLNRKLIILESKLCKTISTSSANFFFHFFSYSTEVNPVPSTRDKCDVEPLDHECDCYYATLAGLMETTIPALVSKTGIDAKPTANENEIAVLYNKAGYFGDFKRFSDKNGVKNYISTKVNANKKLRLAIGYILPGKKCGHVEMIKAEINTEGKMKYFLIDYQKNAKDAKDAKGGRFGKPSLPEAEYFWLWETSE